MHYDTMGKQFVVHVCAVQPLWQSLGDVNHIKSVCGNKIPQWIGLNDIIYILKTFLKFSFELLEGETFFEEVFGNGAFEKMKDRVQKCEIVDRNLKEWIAWSSRTDDPGIGVEKYYIMYSAQLKIIYVGSTELKLHKRFNTHAADVMEILNSSDAKVSMFGTIPIHYIEYNYSTVKTHLEYVVRNTFEGVNGYKFRHIVAVSSTLNLTLLRFPQSVHKMSHKCSRNQLHCGHYEKVTRVPQDR